MKKQRSAKIKVSLLFSLQYLFDLFGKGEFAPNDQFIDWAADLICPTDIEIEDLCRDVIFLICGYDASNLNVVSNKTFY